MLSVVIETSLLYFFFQAEDGIRDGHVTGVQTCALPISQLQRYRRLGAPGDLPARRRTVLRPTAEQAAPSAGHLTPAPPGGDHPPVRPGRFRGSRRAGPPGAAGPTGRSG